MPQPDTVEQLIPHIKDNEQSLLRWIVEAISPEFGLSVEEKEFSLSSLPPVLHIRFFVTDEQDASIDVGRDLIDLKQNYSDRARGIFSTAIAPELTTSRHTSCDFGELPEKISVQIGGAQVTVYPALVDEGITVGISQFDCLEEVKMYHRLGIYRLILLQLPDQRRLLNRLPDLDQLGLMFATVGSCQQLRSDIEKTVMN